MSGNYADTFRRNNSVNMIQSITMDAWHYLLLIHLESEFLTDQKIIRSEAASIVYKSIVYKVLLIEKALICASTRRTWLLFFLLLRSALANLSCASKTTVSTSHRFKKTTRYLI